MNLLLVRGAGAENYTEGNLYVDRRWFCFTLEDADRRLEAGGGKVFGATAIPRGKYRVVIDYSQRFKQLMPRLVDVPGFVGIRIHAGNTAADTDGCILVGATRGTNGRIVNSRAAYNRLMVTLEDALDRGEELEIEVQ